MARWIALQVPVDTGLFTPLGLQPVALCRLGFNAAGHWLTQHAISHRYLVAEHGTGFVVWSAQLRFVRPVGFFDADCLEMRVTGRVRGVGTQFECEVELGDPAAPTARLQACCVPLTLDGGPALSGAPERLSPEVMAAFLPDEIDTRPHRSALPALRANVDREGTVLARARAPFVIHRHQCEVADQWFWPEAVALAGGGREDLVRAEAGRVPQLRIAVRTQTSQLDLLFNRPFFLFDEGVVVTTAHEWKGSLVFTHELIGEGDEQPRALVVEQWA